MSQVSCLIICSIVAQARAIVNIRAAAANLVAGVLAQSSSFTDAEKTILGNAVRGLGAAISAQASPLERLANALANIGVAAVSTVVNSLLGAVNGFLSVVANVDLTA